MHWKNNIVKPVEGWHEFAKGKSRCRRRQRETLSNPAQFQRRIQISSASTTLVSRSKMPIFRSNPLKMESVSGVYPALFSRTYNWKQPVAGRSKAIKIKYAISVAEVYFAGAINKKFPYRTTHPSELAIHTHTHRVFIWQWGLFPLVRSSWWIMWTASRLYTQPLKFIVRRHAIFIWSERETVAAAVRCCYDLLHNIHHNTQIQPHISGTWTVNYLNIQYLHNILLQCPFHASHLPLTIANSISLFMQNATG